MIASRPALVHWMIRRSSHLGVTAASATSSQQGVRWSSSPPSSSSDLTPAEQLIKDLQEDDDRSPTQLKMEAMTKADPWMVFGTMEEDAPPKLPDNPAELGAIDLAQRVDAVMPDGSTRMVHIRQDQWKPGQSPTTAENTWLISFLDEAAPNWINPLMGWVSGSDPMASNIQDTLKFQTASQAVYFAKKRGWQFIVHRPILRPPRSDGAQYQDNFLPQVVASDVQRNKTQCKHWERSLAGASHYQRPLKYHGDGTVPQFGPNGNAPVAKHVPGFYAMR